MCCGMVVGMEMEVQQLDGRVLSGVVVEGHFSELGQRVPAAWQRLAASGSSRDVSYVEFSRELGEGRCLEVLGLFEGTGTLDSTLPVETVQVPGGTWITITHEGPASRIYESFAQMQQWAAAHGYTDTGEKIDTGYRLDDTTGPHVLGIRVLPCDH